MLLLKKKKKQLHNTQVLQMKIVIECVTPVQNSFRTKEHILKIILLLFNSLMYCTEQREHTRSIKI